MAFLSKLIKKNYEYSFILGLFRIVFGSLCILQFYKFKKEIPYYSQSELVFRIPYDFFEWVKPLPEPLVSPFFYIIIVASLLFALGLFYRFSAFIIFIGLTYILLLDVALYNNHYYLLSIIAFLFIFINADNSLSLKNMIKQKTISPIPYWQLFIIQFQIAVLYFFGAIAKINYDWLIKAQPMKLWLPEMYPNFYIGLSENMQNIFAYFISWSGFLIDLFVPFLLFHKKLKWLAIFILIIFHSINSQTFSIGIFPLFGILSLILFLDPNQIPFIGRLYNAKKTSEILENPTINFKQKLVIFFVCTWISIQCILPFRHYAFPGNYRWNGIGYLFSWTMKLSDIEPITRFVIKIDGDETEYTFDHSALNLVGRQTHYIYFHTFHTVYFANYIEKWLKKNNGITKDIKVYCDGYMSLNGRPYQRKINPNIDLTSLKLPKLKKYFQKQDWIIPLESDTLIDKKTLENLLHNI